MGWLTVDVGVTWEDSTTIAGVAAVNGPGVAVISRVAVSVAGMGDGSSVGSGGGDVGVLHPTKAVAIRRLTRKIRLFSQQRKVRQISLRRNLTHPL